MSNKTVTEAKRIFDNGWNKQIILYGPPGTSKTYSATIIAAQRLGYSREDYDGAKKHLDEYKEQYKLIQFHPSYSYEDFVRGVSVKPNEGGGVTYEPEDKIFGDFCKKAGEDENENKPYVLVMDEINRAPLASVLGELIYGLEYRGQPVDTPYAIKKPALPKAGDSPTEAGDYTLTVPKNLYIIGTMNTADRSIGGIDYAVRRRFAFIPVLSSKNGIAESWGDKKETVGKKAAELYEKLTEREGGIFNQYKEDQEMDIEDIKIGHTYFLGDETNNKKIEEDYLKFRVQYQIAPIYKEYIKDGLINRDGLKRFSDILTETFGKEFADKVIPEDK